MTKKKVTYLLSDDFDLSGFDKYEGTLHAHWETGYEGCHLVHLYDDRYLIPNKNYDPTKPEEGMNIEFFHDYGGMVIFENGDILQVEGLNDKIVLIRDREAATKDKFRLSFYPQGIDVKVWKSWYTGKKRATLWRKKKNV